MGQRPDLGFCENATHHASFCQADIHFGGCSASIDCTKKKCAGAGKDAQLCSPCQSSADCGHIGSHTTLPDIVGGLPKGHILAAHFPTVCHHRSCVPLQVPSKDSFCRELEEALHNHEQAKKQEAEQQPPHNFSLSKFAHKVAEPLKSHLSGRKASPARPPVRRLAGLQTVLSGGQQQQRAQRSEAAPAPSNSTDGQQQQQQQEAPNTAQNGQNARGTAAQALPAATQSGEAALVGSSQLSQSAGGRCAPPSDLLFGRFQGACKSFHLHHLPRPEKLLERESC